jgi:probable HAF family extracellular repeat protein
MNSLVFLAVVATLGAAEKAGADAAWTFVDLGTLGGPGSYAAAVSDNGNVVGCADTAGGASHAFLWQEGAMRDLEPTSGTAASCALAVNGKGIAAGRGANGELSIWDGERVTRLGVQGDVGGINESNGIVGSYKVGAETRAFLYSGGALADLPALGGNASAYSAAAAINEQYQVVGVSAGRAFLWDRGNLTDLGTLGGSSGAAKGINDRGEIVGMASTSEAQPAPFLYDGSMRELPAPAYSGALAINNRGQVIGSGEGIYGYLIDNGEMVRLDTLPAVAAQGWRHLEPTGINVRGWIVGHGFNANGDVRAFLLMPATAKVRHKGG